MRIIFKLSQLLLMKIRKLKYTVCKKHFTGMMKEPPYQIFREFQPEAEVFLVFLNKF